MLYSRSSRAKRVPSFLVQELHDHIGGKSPTDLVFPGVRGGGPLRATTFRRGGFVDTAAKAIGIADLHPHELRHTAADLAIASYETVPGIRTLCRVSAP
jgi:integrase